MTKAVAAYLAMTVAIMLSGTAKAQTSVTRTSSFTYDAASGLPIQEVVEPDTPTLRLQTDYGYDAFGNKVSATVSGVDIATRGSSSSFDAKGQFTNSNTNALGQSENLQYACNVLLVQTCLSMVLSMDLQRKRFEWQTNLSASLKILLPAI